MDDTSANNREFICNKPQRNTETHDFPIIMEWHLRMTELGAIGYTSGSQAWMCWGPHATGGRGRGGMKKDH